VVFLLFRAVGRLIGQAGSPGNYGEAKQRRAGIWEHWDGEFGLAEQKRNGQVPCVVLYDNCPQPLRL
jgi:hypothetical protein